MTKKVKQTVIPQSVVTMAKFIQECDRHKRSWVICKKRNEGYAEALRLARNNN